MEEYSYYDKPVKKEKSKKKLSPKAKKIIGLVILYAIYAVLVASIIFYSIWGIGLATGTEFAADLREAFNERIGAPVWSSVNMYIYILLLLSTGLLITILLVRDNIAKKKKKKVIHRY